MLILIAALQGRIVMNNEKKPHHTGLSLGISKSKGTMHCY